MGLMRLQRYRAYGAQVEVVEKFFYLVKVVLPLAFVSICLFGYVLNSYCDLFREFQAVLLSLQWMLLACLTVWCGSFLFPNFTVNDLLLIGLLLVAITAYFIAGRLAVDAIILLAAVTIGKGTQFLLKSGERRAESGNLANEEGRMKNEEYESTMEIGNRKSAIKNFLVGLVGLLAFTSWWHLDMRNNFYHGPRWMGLWNNPNIYGVLMGAGVVLAMGVITGSLKSKVQGLKSEWEKRKAESGKRKQNGSQESGVRRQNWFLRYFAAIKSAIGNWRSAILLVALGMMAVGLVMSYSRGACFGTAVALVYLAWSYGKLKWRYVMLGAGLVALGALCLWGRTPDNAPWYLKRMDFGRPSAQHRVSAWRGALEMMRDHPLGVGWNHAEEIYQKNYSPPENGAAAITTNDYLMLGTQLGWSGLACFVGYVALCFKSPRSKVQSPTVEKPEVRSQKSDNVCATLESTQVACRSAALGMAVAFWFDGGLFTLATASVFWILLELGSEKHMLKTENRNAETIQKSEIGNRKSEILPTGFTLIELLVVIAIIGILAALLLPVLSRAKNKGMMMTDLNNLKQQTLCLHLYASDNGDVLPWPNWRGGDVAPNGVARPGWLYTINTSATGPAQFKAATGLFWNTLRDPRLYMCPMDNSNAPLFALRDQQVSSYAMNGGVIGYNRMHYPAVKLASMSPNAVAFWETDETEPEYFNDGANYPSEGVSARHLKGAVNGIFDGSAGFIKFDTWYAEVDQTQKNQLWCYPGSLNGQ